MNKVLITLLTITVVLFLVSCKYESKKDSFIESPNHVTDNRFITPKGEIEPSATVENMPIVTSEPKVIEWFGISEEGVDEGIFLENMDIGILKEIATEFQTLVEEVQKKEMEDPEFVFRGEWYNFVIESDRYIKVVELGEDAMKPLYWIIYQSGNQGLYEYICCMALEKLSGYDFTDGDSKSWATSKEFFDVFTKMILNDTKLMSVCDKNENHVSIKDEAVKVDVISSVFRIVWKDNYQYDTLILIDTMLDFREFLKNYQAESAEEDILQKDYNDEFFKENIIYTYVKSENSGSIKLKVKGATRSQDNLKLFIERTDAEEGTADMAAWICLFGINRDDINNIKTVESIICE